jgi:WD40 repeat protein
MWNVQGGFTYFTLNNKLIIENTKTREQTVFSSSGVQLSCMAMSVDQKYLAVGEGSQNKQGGANIYLYDMEKKKKINTLPFHQKGIQSLAFSYDSKYLISLGVQGENMLAIFEISSGTVAKQSTIMCKEPMNQIKVDPFVESSHLQFVVVGNNACLIIWRYDIEAQTLVPWSVEPSEKLEGLNFLSIEFTHYLPAPVSTYYIMIGAEDGTIVVYDQQKHEYVDLGMRNPIIDDERGAIGCISLKYNTVVIGTSLGSVVQYAIMGSDVQPVDRDTMQPLSVGSAVIAICMDEMNNEGMVGTESGCIFYVNFMEGIQIQLVQSNNKHQDAVNFVQYDPKHEKVFIASTGEKSDELKVYTTENCDAVNTFHGSIEDDGYVVFVISTNVSTSASNKGK